LISSKFLTDRTKCRSKCILNSLHVKKLFLLYNATLPSSAVVEYVETNWLTKHSMIDCPFVAA